MLNFVKIFCFVFQNIPYSEIKNKTILLKVFDYDRFSKHDRIGELRIPLGSLDLGDTVKECSDLTLPMGMNNDVYIWHRFLLKFNA